MKKRLTFLRKICYNISRNDTRWSSWSHGTEGGLLVFGIGEFVYYASGGVCRIDDIQYAPLESMPKDRQYYVMHSLHDQSGVLYVPVQSETVFLRRILTAQEAKDLLDRVASIEPLEEPNAKALRLKYIETMRRHDPVEWVKVIKTVYRRTRALAAVSSSQRISDTERSFAEDSKKYLYTELSLALDMPVKEMAAYVQAQIEANVTL